MREKIERHYSSQHDSNRFREIDIRKLETDYEELEKTIELLKCCGNCENEDIDYSDNNCMFSGKCKEVMILEVKDKYESYWKPKENL